MEENINLTPEPMVRYEFDFDKIKSVEDVKRILIALRISFSEKYPAFEEVKDLLKEVK